MVTIIIFILIIILIIVLFSVMFVYNNSSRNSNSSTIPIDSHPVESHPVNSHPVESHPVNSHPVESHPVNSYPVDSHPVNSYPVNSDDPYLLPGKYYPDMDNIDLVGGNYDQKKTENRNDNREFYILVKDNGDIELTADNIYFCEKRRIRCSININKKDYNINENTNQFSIIETTRDSVVIQMKKSNRILGKKVNVTFLLNNTKKYKANMNNIELSVGGYDPEATENKNEDREFYITVDKNDIKLTANEIYICGYVLSGLPAICSINAINQTNYNIDQEPEKFKIYSKTTTEVKIGINGFRIPGTEIIQEAIVTFELDENISPIDSDIPIEPPIDSILEPGIYLPDMDNITLLGSLTYDAKSTKEENGDRAFYANVTDGIIQLTADDIVFCGKIGLIGGCSEEPLDVNNYDVDQKPSQFNIEEIDNSSFKLTIIATNTAEIIFYK